VSITFVSIGILRLSIAGTGVIVEESIRVLSVLDFFSSLHPVTKMIDSIQRASIAEKKKVDFCLVI